MSVGIRDVPVVRRTGHTSRPPSQSGSYGHPGAIRRRTGTANTASLSVIVSEAVFVDPDEGFTYCSGRFSASVVGSNGKRLIEETPQAGLADEVLAWARQRADVVVVEIDGSRQRFTAGTQEPRGESLPRWPEDGLISVRRRTDRE
jgi:hypothetical protein